MPSPLTLLAIAASVTSVAALAYATYMYVRYAPVIGRIFEETPMFLPLRVSPKDEGESVTFPTEDGLELAGTYLEARTPFRVGVLVFCHEYLSDRWSSFPYVDGLRDQGFDIFTFDFRNHGQSPKDPVYAPLQWVTEHEVLDLQAALTYLRSRPDADPAGFGLFGVSRGGGTSLCVMAKDPNIWGVVTDGAFPTQGTMMAYIWRWAEIYVQSPVLFSMTPNWIVSLLSTTARIRSENRLHCKYPSVEKAVSKLGPRPWFLIHGAKDAYIGKKIAEELFSLAKGPKESWIVEKAKHNRCRDIAGPLYHERVREFFLKNAPRKAPAVRPEPIAPATAAPARVSEQVNLIPANVASSVTDLPIV